MCRLWSRLKKVGEMKGSQRDARKRAFEWEIESRAGTCHCPSMSTDTWDVFFPQFSLLIFRAAAVRSCDVQTSWFLLLCSWRESVRRQTATCKWRLILAIFQIYFLFTPLPFYILCIFHIVKIHRPFRGQALNRFWLIDWLIDEKNSRPNNRYAYLFNAITDMPHAHACKPQFRRVLFTVTS